MSDIFKVTKENSALFRNAHQIAGRYTVIDVPATVSSAVFGDFIFFYCLEWSNDLKSAI